MSVLPKLPGLYSINLISFKNTEERRITATHIKRKKREQRVNLKFSELKPLAWDGSFTSAVIDTVWIESEDELKEAMRQAHEAFVSNPKAIGSTDRIRLMKWRPTKA